MKPYPVAPLPTAILLSLGLTGCMAQGQGTLGASFTIMDGRAQGLVTHGLRTAPSTCFSGQVPDRPWALQLARSTVIVRTSDSQGTGWVVAGSGDATNPHNRIVTALHVMERGETMMVTSSSGDSLGQAVGVAHSLPTPALVTGGALLPRGDVGVLSIQPSNPAAYDAIQGLSLSSRQAPGMLGGDVSIPAGIDGGASGAAVVDADGKVVGVTVRAGEGGPPPGSMLGAFRRVHGGWMDYDGSLHQAVRVVRDVSLPSHGDMYAEPMSDPDILSALGAAGDGITRDGGKVDGATIAAYPQGTCVVFRADLHPTGQ